MGMISAFPLFSYQFGLLDAKMRIKKQQDVRYVLLLSCLSGAGIQFLAKLERELHWKAIIFYFYLFRKFFSVFTTNCNTVKQITHQAGTVTSKSLMDTPKIRLIA